MALRFEQSPEPDPMAGVIDTSKRFDIYCAEHGIRVVVLRNVKIIGQKTLFQPAKEYQVIGKFMELEQANGSRVFVCQSGILRMCEHGVQIDVESV